MNKASLWTRNFIIDAAANFFIYLVYYILTVVITVYAMDKLHASPGAAGFSSGVFILTALFSRVFAGKTIEKTGEKKTLYIGLLIYFFATFLYFIADNIVLLLIIRSLHGIGFGIAATATGTIVAGLIPAQRRGEGIGYYAMSATLASAIGPFLAIYLNQHMSFTLIFSLAVVLLACSLIAVYFLKVTAAKKIKERTEKKASSMGNFIEFNALPIALVGGLLGLLYSSIISFLAPYTREINLIGAGSTFFVVYSLAILISRPFTGRLFDIKGANFVIYPSFVSFAAGMILLGQAHTTVLLLSAGALLGFGFGTFLSSGQAIAIMLAPREKLGLATSTFFSLTDGGVGIGPLFLGMLLPYVGFRNLYVIMAAGTAITMYLYYLLHGRKKHAAQGSVVIAEAKTEPAE